MPKMTEQDLRAEFMGQLISMRSMSIQSAMLAAEAIVKYIQTGVILGISSPDEVEAAPQRERGTAARAR